MDDAEFTAWASGAERGLLRSAYLLTGHLHRAEGLVQEALVKVALRWPRLRDQHPTAYARTIIVRDNISWWRRHRRDRPVAAVEDRAVSSDPGTALVVRRALALPQDERRRDDGTGWLVTWDVETGELARVASGDASTVMLGSNLVVATALLAGS